MSLLERVAGLAESMRTSFGLLSGIGMALGLLAGFGLPSVDAALDVRLPVFRFAGPDAARSILQTIATATVSVAGLAFSVTLVAFTLTSSQLSPRVLRTFRGDRLIQATLACFLGTFVYCLAVLTRLGSPRDGSTVPNLSITVAIVLSIGAFGLFAAFIAHIVSMLQPSSVIAGVVDAGRVALRSPYPDGVGGEPPDAAAVMREVAARRAASPAAAVRATGPGYVTQFRGSQILAAASAADALVVQRVQVGEYVAPGQMLAEVFCATEVREETCEEVRCAVVLGRQRTGIQDGAFAVRQLADIALKGLSPGVNDPTTAQNAMEALTALLVEAAGREEPARPRADHEGVVRLLALAPDLDELVRVGFEEVRVSAASSPTFAVVLLILLARVQAAAGAEVRVLVEPARQAALLAEGTTAPTDADIRAVRSRHAEGWPNTGR